MVWEALLVAEILSYISLLLVSVRRQTLAVFIYAKDSIISANDVPLIWATTSRGTLLKIIDHTYTRGWYWRSARLTNIVSACMQTKIRLPFQCTCTSTGVPIINIKHVSRPFHHYDGNSCNWIVSLYIERVPTANLHVSKKLCIFLRAVQFVMFHRPIQEFSVASFALYMVDWNCWDKQVYSYDQGPWTWKHCLTFLNLPQTHEMLICIGFVHIFLGVTPVTSCLGLKYTHVIRLCGSILLT